MAASHSTTYYQAVYDRDEESLTIHTAEAIYRFHRDVTVAPNTPAAALARAVLAGNAAAVPALIEAAAESLHLEPYVDVVAEGKRLAEEVEVAVCVTGDPSQMAATPHLARFLPLLKKLEDLGYGEAVVACLGAPVEAYLLRPPDPSVGPIGATYLERFRELGRRTAAEWETRFLEAFLHPGPPGLESPL